MFFDRCQAINHSLPQTQADSPVQMVVHFHKTLPRLHHPGSVTTHSRVLLAVSFFIIFRPPVPLPSSLFRFHNHSTSDNHSTLYPSRALLRLSSLVLTSSL